MSKDLGSLLLWAHYADSFRGICFEIETEKYIYEYDLVKVKYSQTDPVVTNETPGRDYDIPKTILSSKNKAWSYEKEIRLLSGDEFVSSGFKMKAIYFGLRTPKVLKQAIAQLTNGSIPIFETEINSITNRVLPTVRYSVE